MGANTRHIRRQNQYNEKNYKNKNYGVEGVGRMINKKMPPTLPELGQDCKSYAHNENDVVSFFPWLTAVHQENPMSGK